ncbi:MAG: cyclic nucleotide-binding domain-containing protein [bacterium]|nr:cyclic nucleotide-binding domain-containing protein [bacterium]
MEQLHVFGLEKTLMRFSAGQNIFQKGDLADKMYIVKEGEVDIFISEKCVETLTKDGVFGEMALLDASPRGATAVAKSNCRLLAIDEKHFLSHIRKTPVFAIQIMRVLADRLRRQTAY